MRVDGLHEGPSPPAAIGLETALRAPPDGVHPVHLGAPAALADHPVGRFALASGRLLICLRHLGRATLGCLVPFGHGPQL